MPRDAQVVASSLMGRVQVLERHQHPRYHGLAVRISGSHPGGPGLTPGQGASLSISALLAFLIDISHFFIFFYVLWILQRFLGLQSIKEICTERMLGAWVGAKPVSNPGGL